MPVIKLKIDFDADIDAADENSKLTDLADRCPWRKPKSLRKGRGRAPGAAGAVFNSPISAKLNKGRALANSLEAQHKKTFGR